MRDMFALAISVGRRGVSSVVYLGWKTARVRKIVCTSNEEIGGPAPFVPPALVAKFLSCLRASSNSLLSSAKRNPALGCQGRRLRTQGNLS